MGSRAAGNDRRVLMGVLLLFVLAAGLGIARHEMWRDEVEAWLIARDSANIGEIMATLDYNGHPAPWYLGLHVLSRLTQDPAAMQVLHVVLAFGAVALFVVLSPFPTWAKVLFPFGYFPLYEYGIISRHYVIGVVLIFAFCALYGRRSHNTLLLGSILALLANANAYASLISIRPLHGSRVRRPVGITKCPGASASRRASSGLP
jgi:hypothetical protein